jgi:hypothetical protein
MLNITSSAPECSDHPVAVPQEENMLWINTNFTGNQMTKVHDLLL